MLLFPKRFDFGAVAVGSVPQVLWRKVRVTCRHLDGLVAHQFLRGLERHARHDQPTAERVAETMPAEILNPGFENGLLKPSPDRFADKRPSVFSHKHSLYVP